MIIIMDFIQFSLRRNNMKHNHQDLDVGKRLAPESKNQIGFESKAIFNEKFCDDFMNIYRMETNGWPQ